MGLELTFRQTTSISAEAFTPPPDPNLGATAWVNMAFHTKDGQSFTLTAFFSDNPAMAQVYADAINSVKVPVAVITEENCPGHVASENDPKVCGRCGTHIDSLRPPEDQPEPEILF